MDNFVFLGSQISIPLDDSEEVKRKMGQAFGAFNKISNLLTCRQLTMEKRKILIDSCVSLVALYAAETWTLKESDKTKDKSKNKVGGLEKEDTLSQDDLGGKDNTDEREQMDQDYYRMDST